MVFWNGKVMVWYGMVWYGMVWYGLIWYSTVCQYSIYVILERPSIIRTIASRCHQAPPNVFGSVPSQLKMTALDQYTSVNNTYMQDKITQMRGE